MNHGTAEFRKMLWGNLLVAAHQYPQENWDWRALGSERREFDLERAVGRMDHLVETMPEVEWLYRTLADDRSRDVLVKCVMMGILGPLHVQMPLNTPAFWEQYRTLDEKFRVRENTVKVGKHSLHHYRVQHCGRPVHLNFAATGILNTFLLEQYAYRHNTCIEASPGDVVIDGGGCWGDTAVYFAARTGAEGRVHSFEVEDENLRVFEDNVALNPWARGQIAVHKQALADVSGRTITFSPMGPGTHLVKTAAGGTASATTVSIDDFVAANNVPRVDFIKMDIEGSEPAALRGAIKTIARDKPKLAISVYHQPEDLTEVPRIIRAVAPDYRLYLDHFTLHTHETVLFAAAA